MRCKFKKLVFYARLPVLFMINLIPGIELTSLRTISLQAIEYSIDSSAQGTERDLLLNAVQRATAMWMGQNPGLSFTMTDRPSVLQIKASLPWYVNVLSKVLPCNTIKGYTKCPVWDMDTTRCVIHIDPTLIDGSTVDVHPGRRTNIIAHELGHVLGLPHYPASASNHLMGSSEFGRICTSKNMKGYVVPMPLPES